MGPAKREFKVVVGLSSSLVGALALLTAALHPGWGAVAQTADLPTSCRATLTTQNRNCEVSIVAECGFGADAYRLLLWYEPSGLIEVEHTTADGDVISFGSGSSFLLERLTGGNGFSTSEFIERGEEAFYMDVNVTTEPGSAPFRARFFGEIALTGETLVIDGQRVLATAGSVELVSPGFDIRTEYNGVFLQEKRFFAQTTNRTFIDGVFSHTADKTPVLLIDPGEPGFLETTPQIDCESEKSEAGAIVPASVKEGATQ